MNGERLERLGSKASIQYSISHEYDHPVVVLEWLDVEMYLSPGDLREIADDVEEAFAYEQYCEAKGDVDEEPLSKEEWRQMLDDIEEVGNDE